MTTHVVDLNADVVAIRRLRAAAVFPQMAALSCVIAALLFSTLEENGWLIAAGLAGVAALFVLVAHATRRGALSAIWLLTGLAATMTALAIGALIAGEASALERAQFAAGALLILAPSWLLVGLGLTAIRHRSAAAGVHALTRHPWHRIPREQRNWRATIWFVISGMLFALGVVAAILAALAVGGHMWAAALAYMPIAGVAGRFWIRGRRASMLRLREIRQRDTRPPVLLLRSFDDDNLPIEKRYRLFPFFSMAAEALTLESFVVDQIWRLGPVVAIGKPGEQSSPLGAAREYVPDDEWQTRITRLLDEASHVVCILGATPGLKWEYGQVEARGKDAGALIVFPPRPPRDLQRRWAGFQVMCARARSIQLQWEPFIGVPLLARLDPDGPVVLYCRYRHETAYAAAFARLVVADGAMSHSGYQSTHGDMTVLPCRPLP